MRTRAFLMMLLCIVGSIQVCQAQELWRVDCGIVGKVWIEDERKPGMYWDVDTTIVRVSVYLSEVPDDIGWAIDNYDEALVPVPNDVRIEDFVASLREYSWVKSVKCIHLYNCFTKKFLQTISDGKVWPVVRMDGKAWVEDVQREGYYWEADTTHVQVYVDDMSAVPEDITWEFDRFGFAIVPVPEGVLIEDFMASLRAYPWVNWVEYDTYGVYASWDEIVGVRDIHESIPETVQSSQVDIYDLTGRPLRSCPSNGIYIQKGKKVLVR